MAPSRDPRVVVVTGGNSGIGRGIALAFAQCGERVAITGRNEETLRQTAGELGPDSLWVRADVGRREDAVQAVDAVVQRFGRIDVLVNNAGYGKRITTETALDEAESLFDEVVGVNLKGTFLMTMASAAHLPRPGGRIINMSSIGAFQGGSQVGMMAYVAAKAGINALTHALARELGPQGITVNAVAPGFIQTPLTATWAEDDQLRRIGQTPMGRAGTPEDIAAAVMYLASPGASFVTGEVLNVNGGKLFVM